MSNHPQQSEAQAFENCPIEKRDNVKLGMRFVDRAGDFNWRHKLEMMPGDIDCTDMDDAQFEALVMTHNAGFSGAPAPTSQSTTPRLRGRLAQEKSQMIEQLPEGKTVPLEPDVGIDEPDIVVLLRNANWALTREAAREISELRALVLRYACAAGEMSKGLTREDPMWDELRDCGIEMLMLFPPNASSSADPAP